MKPPKFRIKDKSIKIFREHEDGIGTVKKYIHPENTTLAAYIRQLSATEQNIGGAEIDGSQVEFTVNRRNIDNDCFVEHREIIYQVSGIDQFMFDTGTDLTFRAYPVSKVGSYTATQYTDWGA